MNSTVVTIVKHLGLLLRWGTHQVFRKNIFRREKFIPALDPEFSVLIIYSALPPFYWYDLLLAWHSLASVFSLGSVWAPVSVLVQCFTQTPSISWSLYGILPWTTAITGYAVGLKKLSFKSKNGMKFITTKIVSGIFHIAACANTNNTN